MNQIILKVFACETDASGTSCHRLSAYGHVAGVSLANENSVMLDLSAGKVRDATFTAEAFSTTTRHFSSNNLIAIRK